MAAPSMSSMYWTLASGRNAVWSISGVPPLAMPTISPLIGDSAPSWVAPSNSSSSPSFAPVLVASRAPITISSAGSSPKNPPSTILSSRPYCEA